MSSAKKDSKATEMMKRALTLGMGTLFLTEESLRGVMSEFKMPKELLGNVLESANKTKNEFLQGLSQEVLNRISDKFDPMALVQEFLSKNEIELSVKISVKPKGRESK